MELAPLKPSWLLTVLTLSAVLILGKHGIGESLDTPTRPNLSNNGPIKVVATTGFLADIAARIAGQSAQVQSLLPKGPIRIATMPFQTIPAFYQKPISLSKTGFTLRVGWTN